MITLNEIRNRAIEFSHEWEREYNEDAEAKSFWDGFFNVFGVSRRRVASFEHNIKRSDGTSGQIDVFWKGTMLAEHKSRGKDLDKAYKQAKDYFPGLKDEELPRYVIVSDFARIRLYDLDENKEHELALNDLQNNIDLFGFISGYVVQVYEKEEEASIKAASLMAEFHNEIAKTGYSGHDLETFLIRILFCLFADDTGIFDKHKFRSFVENRTSEDGSDLGIKLLEIFELLNTPLENRQTNLDEDLMSFPYINGGIFSERIASIYLDSSAREQLIKCCSFDWSQISAAIFGSLFQGVMEDEKRRELGVHYTSEENIMKVVNSLFLEDLYIEFDSIKYSKRKLDTFHKKLATLKFLDPACGCGNFLVVAYRELRKLELEILARKKGKDGQLQMIGVEDISLININQFYGIEIEEFPVLVARVAMYLVDHQMNHMLEEKFGKPYARIPLREPATIIFDNALVCDWETIISKDELSFILGNPPFAGARIMNPEQKTEILDIFNGLSGVGNLDYVTAWYEKAAKFIQGTKIKVAFVSTNSICQGEQVGILWKRLKNKYRIIIFFAHQTFKWTNDAPGVAAVYCIVIGFACFNIDKKYIFEYKTITSEPKEKESDHINAYLLDEDDIFLEDRSLSICDSPRIGIGNKPVDGGNYLFTKERKKEFLEKEPMAKKYFHKWVGSEEFLNGYERWCLWIGQADPTDIRGMPEVVKLIENVREFRKNSRSAQTIELANTPTRFHVENMPDKNYLIIPKVSSERRTYIPIGFEDPNTLASDLVFIVPNATLYDFGILQSLQHMVWVFYTCGRLKSDYRYSKGIVYNNFPWPKIDSIENQEKVKLHARSILDVRNNFQNSSLADLYDPNTMPLELVKAHSELDKAVDACYGKVFSNKEERIEFLFKLYQQYTPN